MHTQRYIACAGFYLIKILINLNDLYIQINIIKKLIYLTFDTISKEYVLQYYCE